jgi:ribosomal protein L12E/L44/L45/RPP1/RPP2
MKLTRQKVKEALETVSIETVLLGAAGAHDVKLTSKQKEFARQIALGETKASAYRKSRTSKAKPATASRRGQELAANGAIQAQIDAYKVAFEAQKYTSPAHLRALAIQQLTEHSLNPDWPPAQRVRCLELIGKMTEVSLFTELQELIQVIDSAQIKDRLMNTLRTITQAQAVDVDDTAADSLLAELAGPAIEPELIEPELVELEPVEPGPADVLSEGEGHTPHPPHASEFLDPPLA